MWQRGGGGGGGGAAWLWAALFLISFLQEATVMAAIFILERASIAEVVVGAGEGRSLASLGRPRTILRCNVMLLVMRLSPAPIACSWYESVRYIE